MTNDCTTSSSGVLHGKVGVNGLPINSHSECLLI